MEGILASLIGTGLEGCAVAGIVLAGMATGLIGIPLYLSKLPGGKKFNDGIEKLGDKAAEMGNLGQKMVSTGKLKSK
ncbi:hypothetical protein HZA76_00820 [Candidatus Roizmanbacteria bacterium]|nr:hypothetical protein [Candidatus Roizmanbacteria bacterium]